MNLKPIVTNNAKNRNVICERYFLIYRFMTEDLKLGGAKLLVYALIYSFTVNDGSFFGSRGYIAEACGIVMSTTSKALSELLNDGLIERLDVTSFGTVSYRAKVDENGNPVVLHNLYENRDFENRHTEKETPPIRKSDTPSTKIGHNNKDYTKTIKQTNNHANSVCARAEEDTGDFDRFAKVWNTDNVRVILEGENKAEEVEKLKREIEEGTFHGDIKVPGDMFLEDELIQRKHGIIDPKRNREDDLRCTFLKFGYQGMVMLTEPQYEYLTRTYGEDIIGEYIQRLESTMLNKFDFKSYSHYKTILKWLKEDMSCADAFAPA